MTETLPTLLVIRHGETQWNVAGRLQGSRDTPLTVNGMRQAQAVAVRLSETVADMTDAAFWVSPLGRARQTASILADIWSLPFERFAEASLLAERCYGVWEGRLHGEIERDLPEQYNAHAADPWDYSMPGGESRTALAERLREWLRSLDQTRPHVAVTHSGCLRALRGICTKEHADEMLAYREPQTAAFLSEGLSGRMLKVPAATLRAFGCEGEGKTVWI
ncbi:histidine phosphatase family protein (plasmid) [Shinella yambaruensis]|uniref:histidine phosphatase family protein n=1 Tax=Shinella yambaruensis TaxID=415996 RepID=UPI003D7BBEC1